MLLNVNKKLLNVNYMLVFIFHLQAKDVSFFCMGKGVVKIQVTGALIRGSNFFSNKLGGVNYFQHKSGG